MTMFLTFTWPELPSTFTHGLLWHGQWHLPKLAGLDAHIPVVYYHFRWNPWKHHMDFSFFFFTTSLSRPWGSDFFLLTWQLLSKTPRIKGRPVPPAMQRARGGSGSISRGLLFLPIRDTQVFISVWNDARAVGEGEQKTSKRAMLSARNELATRRIDRTRDYYCSSGIFCFGADGSFYYFSLSFIFYGIKRVRITKSDSHLERKVLLHGNLEDLTFYVPHWWIWKAMSLMH